MSTLVLRLQRSARVAALLGLAACTPRVEESPHASLQSLRRAVEEGDTAATLAYVDLDAIAGRLMRDVIAAVEDSLRQPFFDSLGSEARARFDSVQATWRDAFRIDLGLPAAASSPLSSSDSASSGDVEPWSASPDQSVVAVEAEIVGDGEARYRGDTALVARVVRYPRLDTTVSLQLALVPIERRYWRLVAMPNVIAIGRALEARKATVLDRVNRPRRDSIAGRVCVSGFSASREPLEEWDRYAARVRATVRNRSAESLTVRGVQLLGPRLALDDSLGEFLREPLTLRPGDSIALAWERPLRGEHPGPYDVVARPDSYTVVVTAIETEGAPRHRFELYRTWEEYVAENPLPARPSGVLAGLTLGPGSMRRPGRISSGPGS